MGEPGANSTPQRGGIAPRGPPQEQPRRPEPAIQPATPHAGPAGDHGAPSERSLPPSPSAPGSPPPPPPQTPPPAARLRGCCRAARRRLDAAPSSCAGRRLGPPRGGGDVPRAIPAVTPSNCIQIFPISNIDRLTPDKFPRLTPHTPPGAGLPQESLSSSRAEKKRRGSEGKLRQRQRPSRPQY